MPPNTEAMPPSTLGMKPISRRQEIHTANMWLEDKQHIDGAENLWRINDDLYDLTEFINRHPGGSEWIELSKGLDITEAFEIHHFTTVPAEMLKKYFVRKAVKPRNSPYTFHEDGFYKTLKREVIKALPTIPKQSMNTSNFLIDAILVFMFFLSTLAVKYWNFFLAVVAAYFLCSLTISAHNYFHRKDNFRMYYFHFSLMQVREWRISHILSHHCHTNSINDLEISTWQPYLQYLPIEKAPVYRYSQWLMAPLLWASSYHKAFITRMLEFFYGRKDHLKRTDLVAFILPIFMYIFGGQSILWTILMWNIIVTFASIMFFFIGLHAAHHHPDIFHDGDEVRTNYDWGLSQLDAVMDRKEITGSHYLVLTNFGDHGLHHLFPTLDHGTLEHIYPIFYKIVKQFDANLRMVSQLDTIIGGFQQLIKIKPNEKPPNLNKYSVKK